MTDFDQFEQRLAAALRSDADASVGPFEAGSVADAAIADTRAGARRLPRATTRSTRRYGRGRGMTLLAAAAVLLVGGAVAGSGILQQPMVVPPTPGPSFGLVATASTDATSPSPSDSARPSASPIPAAGPGGAWIAAGPMDTPRYDHAVVRLLDGRVLVAGGTLRWEDRRDGQTDLTSAELYDPDSGTWSVTGSMLKPGSGFPATVLRDGRVLVGDVDDPNADNAILGAELYDPASGSWTATGTPLWEGVTATLLGDGRVLVTGNDGAELYDPDSGIWTAAGTMIHPRHSHTATLLPDGRVLVAGGHAPADFDTDSAELYDPETGSWTATANMRSDQETNAAFLQLDGTVLVLGSETVEVYDPAAGTWTTVADATEFHYQRATPLSDGTVLVTGLFDPNAESQPPCSAAALYDPRTAAWMTASSMLRCANGSSFTLLLDGTVLVAGGNDCQEDACVATGSVQVYTPPGVSPPPLPAFPTAPPPVFPTPTPVPTPYPPADGPVPPNARTWKVTVNNRSSEPVALFVAEEDGFGMTRPVGSATPNVVPAGATERVTFLFPADSDPDDGWIFVNPRPGEEGALVGAADIGIPGKIVITAEGQVGWLSPPGY
jgi:hypothetical protein